MTPVAAALVVALAVAAPPDDRLQAWIVAARSCDQSRQMLVKTSSLARSEARQLRLALHHADRALTAEVRRGRLYEGMVAAATDEADRAHQRAHRAERMLLWAAIGVVLAGVGGLVAGLSR